MGLLISVSTATFAMDSTEGWKDGDDLTKQLNKSSLLGGGTKGEAGADDEEDNEGTPKVTYPDAFTDVDDAYDYLSNLIGLTDESEDTALLAALQNCVQALFDQSESEGLQEGAWSDLATNLVAKKESSEEMQAYLEEVSKAHKKAGTPEESEESRSKNLKDFLSGLFGSKKELSGAISKYVDALFAVHNDDEQKTQSLFSGDSNSFFSGIPFEYVQNFFKTATSRHLSALAFSSAKGEKEGK